MGTIMAGRIVGLSCVLLLFLSVEGEKKVGRLYPGFQATQMGSIDDNGLFLASKDATFAFGFLTGVADADSKSFHLVIVHSTTKTVVWSANPDNPVSDADPFFFYENGTAVLQKDGDVIWSIGSDRAGAAIGLQDSGNLVLLGSRNETVWESFAYPTDTLLSNQDFLPGMKLTHRAKSKSQNLSYVLEIDSGDMVLLADYGTGTRQPYWSMSKDSRRIINSVVSSEISSASMRENSWIFYDRNRTVILQFLFLDIPGPNGTWMAVLGDDGMITFTDLRSGGGASPRTIPADPCGTPEHCDPYMVCYSSSKCQCPAALTSRSGCGPGTFPTCNPKTGPVPGSVGLVSAGDGVTHSALGFVSPTMKSDLDGCKSSCLGNCSCLALFFESSSGHCFLFDKIGSLSTGSGVISYVKVSSSRQKGGKNVVPYVVVVAVSGTLIITGLLVYAGIRYIQRREKRIRETSSLVAGGSGDEEDDDFLESLSGAPTRFSYKELEAATNNFSVKLGRGGFGTVYHGTLPDGTQVAVKKLESIGQGKKEFRSEVATIGSIHHIHLVRLRGFCAQGSHRLLAYDYMPKRSLDSWIFRKKKKNIDDADAEEGEEEEEELVVLPWNTRYEIALGTAKGLAYLHEDCDSKIVHCDIKPENVLLDENFQAKVSDFGLAKLMGREQSHVFTTLRGTRGYLAPEWITNQAISEKSDVYSYGMVLLELIGGRKNFDPDETSEKSHFPSYAFRMMEEGKFRELVDSKLVFDEEDERVSRAVKVALWCVQEEMNLRPPMAKVVQMLEGVSPVPQPPVSSPMGYRMNSRFFHPFDKSSSSAGTTSSDYNDSCLSAMQLSGPR